MKLLIMVAQLMLIFITILFFAVVYVAYMAHVLP
jgi:hypothetical protein